MFGLKNTSSKTCLTQQFRAYDPLDKKYFICFIWSLEKTSLMSLIFVEYNHEGIGALSGKGKVY